MTNQAGQEAQVDCLKRRDATFFVSNEPAVIKSQLQLAFPLFTSPRLFISMSSVPSCQLDPGSFSDKL